MTEPRSRIVRVHAHDFDAEEAVLSALLIDHAAIGRIRPLVSTDDFFDRNCSAIFGAALRIDDRGAAVDPILLAAELGGDLEEVGGKEYIGELLDGIPSAANAEYYARRVRELSRRRALGRRLEAHLAHLAESDEGADETITRLQSSLESLWLGKKGRRFSLINDDAIEHLPPVQFLVDDIVPAGSTCTLYGPPSAGKSFIALDLALSVASGTAFHGHPVRRAPVIYFAAEGAAGMGQRVHAWKDLHGLRGRQGVEFIDEPLPLLDPAAVSDFIDLVAEEELRPGLIVFDTLARCLAGGDENSAKDMGLAVASLDRIRRGTGAVAFPLHHSRKDGDSERGSTALRGAMDAMFAVKADEGGRISLSCDKMKDAPPFRSMQFQLVTRGNSAILTTAIASWQLPQLGLTDIQRSLLEMLPRDFFTDGASASQWLKASNLPDRTFYRASKLLCDLGFVERVAVGKRTRYLITETGREIVAANCQNAAD